MKSRSKTLSSYILQLAENEVRIVAASSLKVKSSVALSKLHIHYDKKQSRPDSLSDKDTQAETPHSPPAAQRFLYPARIVLPDCKSRLAFFETRLARKSAVMAVLAA